MIRSLHQSICFKKRENQPSDDCGELTGAPITEIEGAYMKYVQKLPWERESEEEGGTH
jgi:hypothetical protein